VLVLVGAGWWLLVGAGWWLLVGAGWWLAGGWLVAAGGAGAGGGWRWLWLVLVLVLVCAAGAPEQLSHKGPAAECCPPTCLPACLPAWPAEKDAVKIKKLQEKQEKLQMAAFRYTR
jgi:MFS family permease